MRTLILVRGAVGRRAASHGKEQMRRISVLGVTLAVIVVAALAPSATASRRSPRGFAASVKSRCCYYVYSKGLGSFEQEYGTNPKNGVIGSESFRWSWSEGELVKYVENNGEPEFRTVETPSGTPAPVLYTFSDWTSASTDGFYGTTMSCGPEDYSDSSHLEYFQNFTDVFPTSDTSPNVEKYAKGDHYVLRIIGGDSGLGLTPCGAHYSQVALHLEPPTGPNNSEDLADEPEGPFTYWLKLPARNVLRAGKGKLETSYDSTPPSFMACADHAPMPSCPGEGGYGLHTTTEASHAFATFAWFPYSQLESWIKFLKGGKHPG